MSELIKIEKAACDGDLIGYRVSIGGERYISESDGWQVMLVFADQKNFPGFRHGTHFVSNKDKAIEYEEKKIVDENVYCR